MILTIQEAREAVRVDGADNDIMLVPLLDAIPSYMEVTTGKTWDSTTPLAKTAARFILQLWFDPQSNEAEKLKKVIDNLLVVLTTLGRV